MDDTTQAVREMYEQYAYPSGVPQIRVASDVRVILSHGRIKRPQGKPLVVLDAGCGRAVGLVAAATLQPDVRFVGVDMSRTSLADARAQVEQRGLSNVELHEIDLMTLDGLDVPDGGYDVIVSSGVVHHMSEPVTGLKKLREVLAPHGIISLMLYGKHGREPLQRLVRALDVIAPRALPLDKRLAVGRAVATGHPEDGPLLQGPWTDLMRTSDVEFVDRYLNVNESSYSVDELWSLVEDAGLSFLSWCDPRAWSAAEQLAPQLRQLAEGLSARDQYRLVEQIAWRQRLELYVCHSDNGPRPFPAAEELLQTRLAINPEVTFETKTRALRGSTRIEAIACRVAVDEPMQLAGTAAMVALLIKDLTGSFGGQDVAKELVGLGADAGEAVATMLEMLRARVLYVSDD